MTSFMRESLFYCYGYYHDDVCVILDPFRGGKTDSIEEIKAGKEKGRKDAAARPPGGATLPLLLLLLLPPPGDVTDDVSHRQRPIR